MILAHKTQIYGRIKFIKKPSLGHITERVLFFALKVGHCKPDCNHVMLIHTKIMAVLTFLENESKVSLLSLIGNII